jgi:hypothetical protein
MPKTDDILSCLALLGEPQEKVPPLEYPEREVPWRKDYAWEDEMPENEAPGIDPESWLWQ